MSLRTRVAFTIIFLLVAAFFAAPYYRPAARSGDRSAAPSLQIQHTSGSTPPLLTSPNGDWTRTTEPLLPRVSGIDLPNEFPQTMADEFSGSATKLETSALSYIAHQASHAHQTLDEQRPPASDAHSTNTNSNANTNSRDSFASNPMFASSPNVATNADLDSPPFDARPAAGGPPSAARDDQAHLPHHQSPPIPPHPACSEPPGGQSSDPISTVPLKRPGDNFPVAFASHGTSERTTTSDVEIAGSVASNMSTSENEPPGTYAIADRRGSSPHATAPSPNDHPNKVNRKLLPNTRQPQGASAKIRPPSGRLRLAQALPDARTVSGRPRQMQSDGWGRTPSHRPAPHPNAAQFQSAGIQTEQSRTAPVATYTNEYFSDDSLHPPAPYRHYPNSIPTPPRHSRPATVSDGQPPPMDISIAQPLPAAQTRQLKIRPRSEQWHRIVNGDTLTSIAQQHYGDPRMALMIFESNRHKLVSPSILPIGTELVLPTKPPARPTPLSPSPIGTQPVSLEQRPPAWPPQPSFRPQ